MKYKVSSDVVAKIKEIRSKQNKNVLMLGEMQLEYERDKAKLKAEEDRGEKWLEKFGALQANYERSLKFFLNAIDRTEAEQRTVGEAALSEFGLVNPREHYQIDEITGEVRKFTPGMSDSVWANDF